MNSPPSDRLLSAASCWRPPISCGQARASRSNCSPELSDPLPLHFSLFTSSPLFGLAALATRRNFALKFRAAWNFRREFLLAGICGQLMAQVGMTLGVSWSTASNGAILSLLIPIFGALIAVWLLNERLSPLSRQRLTPRPRRSLLALSLARCFQCRHAHPPAHREFPHSHGLSRIAFYNVYSKRLLKHFSGLEILLFSYLSTTSFSIPILFMLEPRLLKQTRSSHVDPVGGV